MLNIIIHPQVLTPEFFSKQTLNYTWVLGGLLGVIYLTGNLLLLPRLGAALTVVITVTGQIIMGVIIDTFGLLGAHQQSFTLFKGVGIIFLITGIIFMNYVRRHPVNRHKNGTIALFILTLVFNRSLKISSTHKTLGKIKSIYFIGGILGMAFVTSNIILMPFLGAALTTIIAMMGQMIMGIIIDHFGLLGSPKNKITSRKLGGLLCIAIGIILLRLF